MGYDKRSRAQSCDRKGIVHMIPKITLKKINGEIIVTEKGIPKVFATLLEAIKYIGGVKHYEPK